jgi:hypothetical protein
MESIYSSAGVPQMKEVHYSEVCGNTFLENPDEFKCSSQNSQWWSLLQRFWGEAAKS